MVICLLYVQKSLTPIPKHPLKHAQTTHAGLTSRWVKAWFPVACCPTFAGPTSTESTDGQPAIAICRRPSDGDLPGPTSGSPTGWLVMVSG